MNSGTSQNLTPQPPKQPVQMQLFPFDPWGSEQVFAVLEHPCPEIGRAMIGPLSFGCHVEQADYTLRCLAVAADGDFAACINLSVHQLGDETDLWRQVVSALDMAKRQSIPSTGQSLGVTPDDCLRRWSTFTYWVPPTRCGDPVHGSVRSLARLLAIRELAATPRLKDDDRIRIEKEAADTVADQNVAGVRHVLAGLNPKVLEIVNVRSRISISLVHRLMLLAKQHGPSAKAYMLQALKTESLGLLHLVASGSPEKESIQVLHAILNGRSLPNTLAAFGIAKATHRRSLTKLSSRAVPAQGRKSDLNDLPLSGGHWLTVMRLIKNLPFKGAKDWDELGGLVTKLVSLDVREATTMPKLLRWCLTRGYQQGRHRLDLLLAQVQAATTAAAGVAGLKVTLDTAISSAVGQGDERLIDHRHVAPVAIDELFDPNDVGQLVMMTAGISGKSITELMAKIFDAHPRVPNWFQPPQSMSVHALSSMETIVGHGIASNNCLKEEGRAIQYVADGLALYAVYAGGKIAGTIALRFYCYRGSPQVLVREITGINNADPSPELSRLARVLADSWMTEAQQACWVVYDGTCERWKRSLQ